MTGPPPLLSHIHQMFRIYVSHNHHTIIPVASHFHPIDNRKDVRPTIIPLSSHGVINMEMIPQHIHATVTIRSSCNTSKRVWQIDVFPEKTHYSYTLHYRFASEDEAMAFIKSQPQWTYKKEKAFDCLVDNFRRLPAYYASH